MATYSTGVKGIWFYTNTSQEIIGTYPNVYFKLNFQVCLHHEYAANSTNYDGARLNFAGKYADVNIHCSGAGNWALWSDSVTYQFNNSDRTCSATQDFSTSFGNVSASGSESHSATIDLPSISSASLNSASYSQLNFSASLSSNPYNFYNIRTVIGSIAKVGTSGSFTGLSPNTQYTASYYVVYAGATSTTLTSAVTRSATTAKPSAPTTGTVLASDITPFGGTFKWSGFSVGTGASSYKYQYSLNGTDWTDIGTGTSLTLSNLNPESTYRFYVRMVDNYSTASDSASVLFTTLVDQMRIPVVMDGKMITTRLYEVDNGLAIKIKKLYVIENGVAKKITNDW